MTKLSSWPVSWKIFFSFILQNYIMFYESLSFCRLNLNVVFLVSIYSICSSYWLLFCRVISDTLAWKCHHQGAISNTAGCFYGNSFSCFLWTWQLDGGWGEKEEVFTVIWSNNCFISSHNTCLWQFDGLTASGLVAQRKWERGHYASLFKVPISGPITKSVNVELWREKKACSGCAN